MLLSLNKIAYHSKKKEKRIKIQYDGNMNLSRADLFLRDTFAPVDAKMIIVHIFISVATTFHWSLFQMDVKKIFLNDLLTKEIYITPSPGLPHPPHDSALFCFPTNRGCMLLHLYVDDILITSLSRPFSVPSLT